MSNQYKKRLVSGERLVCKCSLELPKEDMFFNFKTKRKGVFILNMRGGSLYLAQQITPNVINKVFSPDKPSTIKELILHPAEGPDIFIGQIGARFLRFTNSLKHVGLVLRFVNLSERQMDLFNNLHSNFPAAPDVEEQAIKGADLRA